MMLKTHSLNKFLLATFINLLITLLINMTPAQAAISPLSVAILPPVQFPPSDFSVTGARASLIWGSHRSVYGLDLGLIGNMTENSIVAAQASGIFNYNRGSSYFLGLQFAGIANVNTQKTSVYGLQVALVSNVNTAESHVYGLQLSLANLSDHTDIYGFQVGAVNKAKEVYGVQIGLWNEAANLHGIQIGIINFNQKGIFAVAPLLNVGF